MGRSCSDDHHNARYPIASSWPNAGGSTAPALIRNCAGGRSGSARGEQTGKVPSSRSRSDGGRPPRKDGRWLRLSLWSVASVSWAAGPPAPYSCECRCMRVSRLSLKRSPSSRAVQAPTSSLARSSALRRCLLGPSQRTGSPAPRCPISGQAALGCGQRQAVAQRVVERVERLPQVSPRLADHGCRGESVLHLPPRAGPVLA